MNWNMVYGINTIIKCDTRQPVEFQLVSRSWNEMIFTLFDNINSEVRYISLLIQFKNERLTEILHGVKCYILWSYKYNIKSFLDKNKCLPFF